MEWASCWKEHLSGMGILPVPDSRLPTPDSLGALSVLRIKFATGRTAPDSRPPHPYLARIL
ncbi:hypothetical protein BJP36_42505 [Moorena producens JHB]|uniref:Uncharacterized protein n=1 Tax=Moorena producens (strain JHB) TaxID=1454205 RepID=A0A9Q9SSU8_MOOP1|nr:hypothetical protein [Moorena producens]WAN69029.1 hypothetical protein BJP36_42505 [Moorena producens JHB]